MAGFVVVACRLVCLYFTYLLMFAFYFVEIRINAKMRWYIGSEAWCSL